MAAKIHIDAANVAVFKCPECKKSWKKDLSQVINRLKNNRINCNCPCGCSFPVLLERKSPREETIDPAPADNRRHKRKIATLTGGFIHDKSKRRGAIYIKNISKSGVGFELSSDQFMHIGDRLSLKFNLDDPDHSFLYEEVIVKKIQGRYVGAEFCEFRHKNSLELYVEDD